ncbi:MAG: hypothetical protein IPH63_14430 [Flavobacteriales bacterium]|nr:hypothetical protein [Flavobacteriales bacterium]
MVNKVQEHHWCKNQEFTTILDITVEDEVGVRAKMFLDTLSREYMRYTLQSEFDINENTLNYIDKQLAEVTVILEQHEDEAPELQGEQEYPGSGREETLYFTELISYDHQKRNQEIQLKSMESLEDYVLNSEDEKLLPPALYITDDDFQADTGFVVQHANGTDIGPFHWDRGQYIHSGVGLDHPTPQGYSTHVHQECEACHRAEDGRSG